jgi:hypothetical protein
MECKLLEKREQNMKGFLKIKMYMKMREND